MIQISAFMTHSNLHDAGKKEKENEKKNTGLSIMKRKQKITKLRASLNYGRKIMSVQVQISKFCKCVRTLVQTLMQKKGEKHHIEEQNS